MVGEIRDGETAKISIEAALTGHLVLSTLHTNDAPSAITRLNEMGVEPFLTGAAVSAVLAQRLARKLCTHCAEPYQSTWRELRGLHLGDEQLAAFEGTTFHRRRGCPRCGQTGYRGRVGVFQLLPMSERLEQLASEKAPREEIERAAAEEGMRTMWEDGIGKVDVTNVLRGGVPQPGENENGSWRYQVRTQKLVVVVAFRDEETAVIVTAWRLK